MSNPYEVSPIAPDPAMEEMGTWPVWQMRYMESFHYIFRNPNWATNVLMGFLCILSTQIIPVIGHLVLMGYIYEIAETLHRTNGERYPDFDFNRFSSYLMRALGPLLVSLVAMTVFLPAFALVVGAAFALPFIAGAAEASEPVIAIAVFGAILLGLAGYLALALAYNCIMTPLCLRGAFTENVGESFQFAWSWEFAKKTWVEVSLAMLFLIMASLIASVGLFAFCIGIYATVAIVFMMSGHLTFQIYRVYLSRGGDAIPLKSNLVPPAKFPPLQ
jgi:hypothetical protein